MKRELEFRYVYEFEGEVDIQYFTLGEIENGYVNDYQNQNNWDYLKCRERYTGLVDKQGVKIFEGDIVAVDYKYFDAKKAFVEWDDCNPCFVLIATTDVNIREYDFSKCGTMELEVIDNIHEEPKA